MSLIERKWTIAKRTDDRPGLLVPTYNATVDGPDTDPVEVVPADQLTGAAEELRALLHAADEEAQSQFEPPDRLRQAILRADAWLATNGLQA